MIGLILDEGIRRTWRREQIGRWSDMGRSARKQMSPDVGMLAARLLFRVQGELFARTAEQGFADVGPRHGGVLAYLDEEGIRVTELARLTGRSKQTTGAILDELEQFGYLVRSQDPSDKRARLVVPTPRGLELMTVLDRIIDSMEQRQEAAIGDEAYQDFKQTLARLAFPEEANTDGNVAGGDRTADGRIADTR
jgi:DNA-binding MarR family transcriptional regulator